MRGVRLFGVVLGLGVGWLVLSGCSAAAGTGQAPTDAVWTPEISPAPASATPFSSDPEIPTGTPGPLPVRTGYTLEAVLDYEGLALEISEQIIYPNRTGLSLDSLVLIVDAAHETGVFELLDLTLPDGPLPEKWTLADGVLTIDLAGQVPNNTVVTLEIVYTLTLPVRPGKLGSFDSQLNLGDWYPMFPAYKSGEGWLVHPVSPVGETIVYPQADFDVLLEIRNAPEKLIVAASAAIDRSDNDYRLEAEGFRNVSFSMSEWFSVREGKAGEVTVLAYAMPGYDPAASVAYATALKAIEVFSDKFSPYPHETYTIVSGNFPDGLEYDGLTFVSLDYYGWYDGTLQNYLPLLIAHEAAHQWWYGKVGSDPAEEPWLDETLATYSELIYLQALTGNPSDWWWGYRLDPFRPLGGNVDDSVYDHSEFRPYVNAIYLRGVEMLRDLRIAMGGGAFSEALRAYSDRYSGKIATGQDFMQLMEAYSANDLTLVWERYFQP